MAAYAALLSLSQTIESLLPPESLRSPTSEPKEGRAQEDTHTHDQDYFSFSTKDPMISLHQNIISLQEFLEDVPMKFTSKISPLERRLTDVAYQLEDLIESSVKGSPCDWFMMVPGDVRLVPTTVFNSCIQEVGAILQKAEEMKEMFKQQDKDTSAHDSSSTPSASVVVESSSNNEKVGLVDDLEQICTRVTSDEQSLQIIPIVGMGGIGKTTLARAVYENMKELNHFDVCLWVTISQQYNKQDILQKLLDQQQSAERTEQDLGPLITSVHQKLYNRRFLIVLDDMWDAEAWNGVMTAIPNCLNGSRVILTTRLSEMAKKVSSSTPQHQMQLMNRDTSWDLLREKVYERETCQPEFEAVGRKIAENCKGLPLRIVVVAGMLKSNMSKDYWEEVDRNINEAAAPGGDGQLERVLSLSYDNLPPHLKSCFLYFGSYPEDERIQTKSLVWRWVSEGFVKPKETKTPEEIAEEYLEDLAKRSLVLIWERGYDGKIEWCGIHDILRELSLIKAKEDKFLQCFTDSDIKDGVAFQNLIKSQRRVSVLTKEYDSLSFPDADTCNTTTRSLLFNKQQRNTIEHFSLLTSCPKLLKVLHNVEVRRDSMFTHLFELTNLRLLRVQIDRNEDDPGDSSSQRPIRVVPKSISNLEKLETLIVDANYYLLGLSLPVDIWKIHKLRHIDLPFFCTLELPPTELSEAYPVLQHLQTLKVVTNLVLVEGVILRMPNLKVLEIMYLLEIEESLPWILNDLMYRTMERLKNLVRLCQLEDLQLTIMTDFQGPSLPADFVFPNNLKRLRLSGTPINPIISWEQVSSMVGSLPNLQSLELTGGVVEGSTWEPAEGQFQKLKHLELQRLELKYWWAESTHFPCLEELVLEKLRALEEIPVDIGYILTLKKLRVRSCSKEAKKSAEKIHSEQQKHAHSLQVEISTDSYGSYGSDGSDGSDRSDGSDDDE